MICNPFYILNKDSNDEVNYILAPGFNKLDYFSEELQEAFYKSAELNVNSLDKLQFELLYYMSLSKGDSDNMSYSELLRWYELAVKKRDDEVKKSQEK